MKRRSLVVGLLLALAIAYAAISAPACKREEAGPKIMVDKYLASKVKLTEANLDALSREVLSFAGEGEGLPESLEALRRFHPTAGALPDAWGTRIRYLRLSDSSFRLTSAGPDKAFDTADDIVKDF